jgi:hypothetical protein
MDSPVSDSRPYLDPKCACPINAAFTRQWQLPSTDSPGDGNRVIVSAIPGADLVVEKQMETWDIRSMYPLREIFAHPLLSFSSLLPKKSFGAPATTLSGVFSPYFPS